MRAPSFLVGCTIRMCASRAMTGPSRPGMRKSGSVNSSPHPCPSGVLPCKRPVDTPYGGAKRTGLPRQATEDLGVVDGEPGVGVEGPGAPGGRDPRQLLAGRPALVDQLVGEGGAEDAVGPHPTPPVAGLGGCPAPGRGGGGD